MTMWVKGRLCRGLLLLGSLASLGCEIVESVDDPDSGQQSPVELGEAGEFFSDDFHGETLKEGWTFVDPLGDSQFALVGSGTSDAFLTISVPAGVTHDLGGLNQAPRMVQAIKDVDLDVELKFESKPSEQYQIQGLLFEEDQDSYVRVDVFSDGEGTQLYAAAYSDGEELLSHSATVDFEGALFLRAEREGANFLISTSLDGKKWEEQFSFEAQYTLAALGLHAGNAGDNPAFTAEFDYIMNLKDPIGDDGDEGTGGGGGKGGGPLPGEAVVSDDFRDEALNGAWTFVDPIGDSEYALKGAGSEDAWLTISVPEGNSHDPNGTNTAPRMMQEVPDQDLHVEAKFESLPSKAYQIQGLVFEEDEDSFLRADIYSDGNGTRLYLDAYTDGVGSLALDQALPFEGAVYLRVKRVGDQWTVLSSTDGVTWVSRGEFEHAMQLSGVGLQAGNGGDNPAFVAEFDYLMNLDAPLEEEDPFLCDPSVNRVVVSAQRRGVGLISSSHALGEEIPCDTKLTLTAAPLAGWRFTGWSGDLSGTDSDLSLTASRNVQVVAEFERYDAPPVERQERPYSVSMIRESNSLELDVTSKEAETYVLSYGTSAALEGGTLSSSGAVNSHQFSLTSLSPLTSYFFRLTVGSGPAAIQSDIFAVTTLDENGQSSAIEFWHVPEFASLKFGHLGQSQRWANVLGHVSGAPTEMYFSLNGGQEKRAGDSPRINKDGDFNLDFHFDDLEEGLNVVEVRAVFFDASEALGTIVVENTVGQDWPLPYVVYWPEASIMEPQDVVQLVDGKWALSEKGLRTLEPGYDRVITVGDQSWVDYEVMVEFTLHQTGVGTGAWDHIHHFGMATHWQGHTISQEDIDESRQPYSGWYPFGALMTYTWEGGARGYDFWGPDGGIRLGMHVESPDLDTLLIMKCRAETLGNGEQSFHLKVWEAADDEPAAWSLEDPMYEADSELKLKSGAALFLAQYIDVTYGNIWAMPLP